VTPTERRLTVALDATDRVARARHEVVLATLPAQFEPTSEAEADVVVVSGLRTGWIDVAADALRAGARGVLIARPGTGDPEAVRVLAAAAAGTGAVVAVETLVVDPAWSAALARLRASLPGASLLHAVTALDGADDDGRGRVLAVGLLEQLALVRSVTGGLDEMTADFRGGGSGYWISGAARGVPVSLAGTISSAGAPALRLDLVTSAEHWKIRFDTSAPAGPTHVARFDADGGELWPEVYERGHRVVWRQLAAALLEGAAISYGLADLADDLALAERLTRPLWVWSEAGR
jgi:hypothetical protein